jgi:hypothetical protein
MQKCLTNVLYGDGSMHPADEHGRYEADKRNDGRDWPSAAHTMIGMERLKNVRSCVERALDASVAGDFVETGVWRGGASIMMRAVLAARGVTDRVVWVADSFQGLPPPDVAGYPQDTGDELYTYEELAIPLDVVQSNFAAYDLLDDQVAFLPGWFRDTLPSAPIERIAVLRLDGDMYESTMIALQSLYPKLSTGGFLIVDDFGAIPTCAEAVHDYRRENAIVDPLERIDWTGVYWRKS